MKTWKKLLKKESEESDLEMEITFESEDSIVFHKDGDEWRGSCIFMSDNRTDFNNLESIREVIDVLNMIKSLKEENETIQIKHDGDRGGEYFDITIPESVMNEIEEV